MNMGIFDMFQALAEILKGAEPEPSFSQLVHDLSFLSQLSQLSYLSFQKSLSITAEPQKTPELGRNGSETLLWISQVESTLSVVEEDQLLETANDSGLKIMFETTSNLHVLD